LVLSINFTFFNKQHRRADAATNTQTAASPGRWLLYNLTPRSI
jgi:hypothetical protein